MSVELRQLKDAITKQPFVPVTHWDAVSNKPDIDGSINDINTRIDELNTGVRSVTGDGSISINPNDDYVAVSASSDASGNITLNSSVQLANAITLSTGSSAQSTGLATDGYVKDYFTESLLWEQIH